MDSPRRTVGLLVIVGLLLTAGIALAITGTVPVSDGVSLQAPGGMNATLTGSTDAQLEEPFPTSGTVQWTTEAGNVSFFSSGDASATVHVDNIEGTWTNITAVEADPNTVTVDPGDKPSFIVAQEIASVSVYETIAVDDGTVDFVYDAQGGPGEVTLQSLPGNQELVAVDANSGTYVDTATSTGGGAVTFDALDSGTHSVEVRTASFEDPTLSNPSPAGDLSADPSQISIDVADPDFDRGDSVDVMIELDGSQIHSETITANQTVATSMPSSGQTGGGHEWTVSATPDFGNPTTDSYSYRIPDELTIRSETDHSEIINSPINSSVTFFGEDQIVTRETDTGTIGLDGLAVNDDFIAEITPSDDNWTSRAIYFESIFQQQSAYLLNTSAVETTQTRFILSDPTGEFDTSTVLFIERPINTSTENVWRTVHADEFGAEGVTATLQEGQRYRLRVMNEEGTQQVIGPFRADASETVTVQPGTPGIELQDYTDGWAANARLDNVSLEYAYDDPQNETDQVTVWIHEKGDPSNRLQTNETYFDLGSFDAEQTITVNESEKTWVVNFIVNRGSEQFTKRIEVSNQNDLFGELGDPWDVIVGVGLLLLLAGAFSYLNAPTGAVVVASTGGILWYFGLLGDATSAIGISLGIMVAVINHVRVRGGP